MIAVFLNRITKAPGRSTSPARRVGKILCGASTLLLLAGCDRPAAVAVEERAAQEPAAAETRTAPARREAAPAAPIVQAHRGAGDLAPENTLPTFELGWRMGAIPEADVRLSKDGVPVAFHDDTFARLVKDAPPELRKKGVHDLTWNELSQLDVGSWKGPEYAGQRIPRIADVFALMRGRPERRLYLDIKKVPLEQLAAMAREYGVERQVIVASTRYEYIREWKRLVPESQTLLWMGGTQEKLAGRIEELKATDFADVTQLQIHVQVGDLQSDDPFKPSSGFLREVAGELRRRGILFQTLPWGKHDPVVYAKLMDLGVESFATDDPETTLKAVRAYREKATKPNEPNK